jgi:hypothetical protein
MVFVFGCVYIVKVLFGLTFGELHWSREWSVCGCLWKLCVRVHGNCVWVFMGTVCGVHGKYLLMFIHSDHN